MTVDELLARMSSAEITEWHVFFQMQEDELERRQRKASRETAGPKAKPSIGDAQGRTDAITQARQAQGLE